jgi:hypothetical protein
MQVEGKLERQDIGTGVWVVSTDDGRRFMLDGAVPEGLAGKRVRVDGDEVAAMGIGMVGDTVVAVRKVVRA